MDIRIYQIDTEKDQNHVCFQPLESLHKIQRSTDIDSSLYKTVFSGKVQAKTLDDVYRIFNLEHPPEHAGRSLSVSDIVEVTASSSSVKEGFYFCDSFDFKKVSFDLQKVPAPELVKGVLLEPGKEARIAEVLQTRFSQQHLVDGWPEALHPFEDNVVLLRNDKQEDPDLPFNRALRGKETIKDLSYAELCKLFRERERQNPDIHALGYIVFSEDSFSQPYSLESRTYAISSNNKAFQAGCGGYSIFGGNLDGTDPLIRLDAYMANEHGGKDGWKIARCYIKEPGPVTDTLNGVVFICGQEDGKYVSLTTKQLDSYMSQFCYPEQLFKQGNELTAQPYKPKKVQPALGNLLSDAEIRRDASSTPVFDQTSIKNAER